MGHRYRRSPGTRAALALVVASLALPALGPVTSPAAAGIQTNANACFMDANGLYSTVDLTVGGTAVAGSPTSVGLDGLSLAFTLPDAIYLELYSLGYYTVGSNFAGVAAEVTVAATNTAEQVQSAVGSSSFGVDISDPDGVRNTGDEAVATSPVVQVSLPATTWTPTGGRIDFTQASATITTNHFFGSILATLTCAPGSTPDRVTTVPAVPVPFEGITPPTPPSCTDTTVIGGQGVTTDVNLPALCVDDNGDIDLESVVIVADPAGGTASVGPAGVITYTNTDPNIGTDAFQATISDASGLVSAPVTISLVIQSVRSIEQDASRIDMAPVVLDGEAQVAVGGLGAITVTNLPTSGLGFTVSAYATDLTARRGAPCPDRPRRRRVAGRHAAALHRHAGRRPDVHPVPEHGVGADGCRGGGGGRRPQRSRGPGRDGQRRHGLGLAGDAHRAAPGHGTEPTADPLLGTAVGRRRGVQVRRRALPRCARQRGGDDLQGSDRGHHHLTGRWGMAQPASSVSQ